MSPTKSHSPRSMTSSMISRGQLLDPTAQRLRRLRREAAADEQLEAVVLGRVHHQHHLAHPGEVLLGRLGHRDAPRRRAEQARLTTDGADVVVLGDRPEPRPVGLRVPVHRIVGPQPRVLVPRVVPVEGVVGREVDRRSVGDVGHDPRSCHGARFARLAQSSPPRDPPRHRWARRRRALGAQGRRCRPAPTTSAPPAPVASPIPTPVRRPTAAACASPSTRTPVRPGAATRPRSCAPSCRPPTSTSSVPTTTSSTSSAPTRAMASSPSGPPAATAR